MKFEEWLNLWLENYVKPSAKTRTVERYKNIIDKQIGETLKQTELDDLSALDIQLHVTRLLNCGNAKTRGGLAASSVNVIITVIQNSLKTAAAFGYVKSNAASGVKRPKIKTREITCFTSREQKQIEFAVICDKRRYMFGVVLCLYTGLRVGELLALVWANVDFEKYTLSVTTTCHDRSASGYGRVVGEPKTFSSKRLIPLPKQLIAPLKKLKASEKSEYVISREGKPLTIRAYQAAFARLLRKIGVEHKGFHSLRHTFATRALECGMDVKTLSEILGHKNATITLNRYAHSLTEHKRDMMNRLGKLFEI